MEVTYHLNESEFDLNVFKAIKAAFKNSVNDHFCSQYQ